MGLLDEAIREHLELQRQQGADPGEIARKEREALEPVLPDEPATWGGDASGAHDGAQAQAGVESVADEPTLDSHAKPPEPHSDADLSAVGQETVEIDMREVLAENGDGLTDAYPPGHAALAPARARRITNRVEPDDPELEWEIAGHATRKPEPSLGGPSPRRRWTVPCAVPGGTRRVLTPSSVGTCTSAPRNASGMLSGTSTSKLAPLRLNTGESVTWVIR